MLVIDYDNLVKNHIEIIKYAIEYGETFSVMTNLKKPYSKIPPIFEHDEVMKTLNHL